MTDPNRSRKGTTGRRLSDRAIARQIEQAVRNFLNLPALRVRARRSPSRGVWLVRLVEGAASSEWLELDVRAVTVAAGAGLLPPRLLGVFRLAYDSLKRKKAAAL